MSVSTTRPDLSPLPARSRWKTFRQDAVVVTLLLAILGPILVSGEFAYFRYFHHPKAVSATRIPGPIPPPFVNPGIIIVQPPAETRVETETTVAPATEIPEAQRRGKHRADEPEVTTTPPVVRAVPRRVAPASSTPAPPPTVSTTPPPVPTSTLSPSTTPIYDTLRNERIASDPNAASAIPQ